MPEHVGVILDLPLYRWLGLLAPEFGLMGTIRSIEALLSESSSVEVKTLTVWTMSLPASLELGYCQRRIRESATRQCRDLGMELAVHISEQESAGTPTSTTSVNIYLTFDGKQQVVQALRRASRTKRDFPLTERDVEAHLSTNQIPALDLVIRTSSTKCMRGFMLWQSVRSEYWFHESILPFSGRHFHAALRSFATRQRRNGA